MFGFVRRGNSDMNFIVGHSNFKDVGFDAWIVGPGTVVDIESPAVPRTGYVACVGIEMTFGQRCSHMRAHVIDC